MNQYDNYLTMALGAGGQSAKKILWFHKNYDRFLPDDKGGRILDIGPGKAEMLSVLNHNGFKNIEAVDISESVTKFVADIGFKVTLTKNLEDFLENKIDTFSLIVMCDVLEHIPKNQILSIMNAVYNALQKNGLLIIQTPNMQSIVANIFRYDDFTHEIGYTERSLTQMLSIAGYNLVNCYGFEFLDNGIKSKIQYVLRGILWSFIKLIRKINTCMPHKIMHPVFFAIARKS